MTYGTTRSDRCRHRRLSGFTLIELVIAMAVVAILAAVALPSYLGSVRKSRRSEALTAIAQVQQAQERWRANNSAFANHFGTGAGGLKLASSSDAETYTTSSGYYVLRLPAVGSGEAGTKYIIRAEAQGSQAGDANCKFLQLTQDKGNTRYQSGSSAAVSNDTTANNQCWKR